MQDYMSTQNQVQDLKNKIMNASQEELRVVISLADPKIMDLLIKEML